VIGTKTQTPTPNLTVVGQVIDAVNHRDRQSLLTSLAGDAVLEFPWVRSDPGREGDVYMVARNVAEPSFLGVWVGTHERWGLEARLGGCRAPTASTVVCAVASRWHTLQMEMGEEWTFEIDAGRVTRLRMVRVDPDPPERQLPLGLNGLASWEAWLRETHPAQADRLLPTGPDLFGHMYFRFGLDASPDEIKTSIREYLETRP
jgi:hypothetical protein